MIVTLTAVTEELEATDEAEKELRAEVRERWAIALDQNAENVRGVRQTEELPQRSDQRRLQRLGQKDATVGGARVHAAHHQRAHCHEVRTTDAERTAHRAPPAIVSAKRRPLCSKISNNL